MTETVMPPDILAQLKPDFIVPLVAVLCHPTNKQETGSIFEVGGGHMAKLRWERSKGLLLKPDDSYTPGAILSQWDKVKDYSSPEYPNGVANFAELLEEAVKLSPSKGGQDPSFKDKVVVITGGDAGWVYMLSWLAYFKTNSSQSRTCILPALLQIGRQGRCE